MTETPQMLRRRLIRVQRRRLLLAEAASCKNSFETFVRAAWHVVEPGRPLRWNWHLDVLCQLLEAVRCGEVQRLIINVPPRTMKSLLVNVLWPVWCWLHDPARQFLNISTDASLATRDSMRSRTLLTSDWFQDRWGDGDAYRLRADQNQKDWYQLVSGGTRLALGMTSKITGKGADVIVVDDPHNVTGARSEAERTAALAKFDDEISGRLNDQSTGSIVVIMQRLHEKDLTGHLLAKGGWSHVCIPMEFEPGRADLLPEDPRTKPGELLWPERFPRAVVDRFKRDMTPFAYAGQHQQRPAPDEGGILKRAWWRAWPAGQALPACEYIIVTIDGAFEAKEQADYTAATVWGLFWHEQDQRMHAIILERYQEQVDFPDLREDMRELYGRHQPDVVLIEPKASGKSLVQELRRSGVPATEWKPERSRSGKEVDKRARTHAAAVVPWGGAVWYPTKRTGEPYGWVAEVIDQCSLFPNAAHDDLVDTCTMAWLYLRRMHWVDLSDEDPEPDDETEDARQQLSDRIGSYG